MFILQTIQPIVVAVVIIVDIAAIVTALLLEVLTLFKYQGMARASKGETDSSPLSYGSSFSWLRFWITRVMLEVY